MGDSQPSVSEALALPARPLRLHPFRGLMLGPSRIGDPGSARAFSRPYRQVVERLEEWQSLGQALHDDAPHLYLHEYAAEHMCVRGLVGALDVSRRIQPGESPGVHIHEAINEGHAAGLGQRMEDLMMNPAPILLAYTGTDTLRSLLSEKAATTAEHEFTDRSRQHHRIWSFSEQETELISHELQQCTAMVADGHHRFAAYLTLQHFMPDTAWDRGLAMLVDQQDTPLFLGAIHRVLRSTALEDFTQACESAGVAIRSLPRDAAVAALGPRRPVITDGTTWLLAELPEGTHAPSVAFLHAEILPKLTTAPASISFHHSVDDTLVSLTHDDDLAVLLPAPSYRVISEHVVGAGHLLPEKATSFQPKPSVGVIMRMLADE